MPTSIKSLIDGFFNYKSIECNGSKKHRIHASNLG